MASVTASASLAGPNQLTEAVNIKNFLNGLLSPIPLISGMYRGMHDPFSKNIYPRISVYTVCLFAIIMIIIPTMPSHKWAIVSNNSLVVSEWFSLMGFVSCGMSVDMSDWLTNRKVLSAIKFYSIIVVIKIFLTFGFSYWLFET